MTTALDTKLRPKVLALIARLGKNITVSVPDGKSYNPATGVVSGGLTNHVVKATPPARYAEALVDGELIQVADVMVTLAAQGLAFTPVTGLKVTIDSSVWRLIKVAPIYSGDLVAAWELQLRQ